MRARPAISRDQVGPDTPLRLAVAAALAYPDGSMTASGLRREAARGHLALERTAGKDYTTLAAIERMRELCRVTPPAHTSGSARSAATPPAGSVTPQHGSSSTVDIRRARSALDMTLAELRLHSSATSTASTKPRRSGGSVIPLTSRLPTSLTLYAELVAPRHARPKETAQRIARLAEYFTGTLAEINGESCRAYGKGRTDAARREDLSVLRAAINFHREEGHCDRVVSVALPDKNPGRERWLTRDEAAALIRGAWRFRETQKGVTTTRASRQHVARFILVALYTGTRAGAVCAAALDPVEGRAFIDLDRGIFYRRPAGAAETRKRRPPVPIPRRLLAHLRRWKRRGQASAVEWNGRPVKDVDKAFRRMAHEAGMPDVTPHVLRHTAATWLMQLGTDLWEAAGYLGMSVEQLERNYGHHHPNHLRGARDAFDRPPKSRQYNAGTERETSSPNVRKIADNR